MWRRDKNHSQDAAGKYILIQNKHSSALDATALEIPQVPLSTLDKPNIPLSRFRSTMTDK